MFSSQRNFQEKNKIEIFSTNNTWTSRSAKDLQKFASNICIVDTFARYLVTIGNNCVKRTYLLWFNGQ